MHRTVLLLAAALTACSTPGDNPAAPAAPSLTSTPRHPATYSSSTASPEGPRPFAYRTHVRPLLQSSCTLCHCPSLASRSGNLDLTTREAALSTGNHAPVIIPGSAATSPFIHKLTTTNAEGQRVPIPGGPHALTPRALASFSRWIDEGADWTY